MQKVNIHEAKKQLSRLIEQAVNGEPFIIAKAGKPLVKVTSLDAPVGEKVKRLAGGCTAASPWPAGQWL